MSSPNESRDKPVTPTKYSSGSAAGTKAIWDGPRRHPAYNNEVVTAIRDYRRRQVDTLINDHDISAINRRAQTPAEPADDTSMTLVQKLLTDDLALGWQLREMDADLDRQLKNARGNPNTTHNPAPSTLAIGGTLEQLIQERVEIDRNLGVRSDYEHLQRRLKQRGVTQQKALHTIVKQHLLRDPSSVQQEEEMVEPPVIERPVEEQSDVGYAPPLLPSQQQPNMIPSDPGHVAVPVERSGTIYYEYVTPNYPPPPVYYAAPMSQYGAPPSYAVHDPSLIGQQYDEDFNEQQVQMAPTPSLPPPPITFTSAARDWREYDQTMIRPQQPYTQQTMGDAW